MRVIPLGASRHKTLREAQHNRRIEMRGGRSDRQVEAMTAEQAEVVGEDVAVERLAQLSAE